MKVSRAWLNNFFHSSQSTENVLPPADALADALTFHVFEIDGIEKQQRDDILDVKVTPNRGHDCLSHRGIAKELSAILKLPLVQDPLGKGFADRFAAAPRTEAIKITLEDASLGPRYIAAYITGVKVGPSPDWMKFVKTHVARSHIKSSIKKKSLAAWLRGILPRKR
jgi:hypothetical protein